MSEFLARAYNTDAVLESLSNPRFRYIVAESRTPADSELVTDSVVGFVHYTLTAPGPAHPPIYDCLKSYQTDDGGDILEIRRLYVDYTFHGGGAGQALLDAAIVEARALKRTAVWLGVYPGNARAIRFYTRNGFEKVGEHQFVLGEQVDTDDVMVKVL